MAKFLAWANLILFGGMGVAVLVGVQIPEDPECYGRCMTDTMAKLQEDIGSGPLSTLLFASGLVGYVWYAARS